MRRRFSVRPELLGSPAAAKPFQDFGCRDSVSRSDGSQRGGESFVKLATLVSTQVIAFIVGDEIDRGSFGQRSRFVKNKATVFDTR
jgi:hypothetical protein